MTSVGKHLCRLAGDTLFVATKGEFDLTEIKELHSLAESILAAQGMVFFIVDISGGLAVSPEARKWTSAWNKEHQVSGVVLINASTAIRALVGLSIAAASLLRRNRLPLLNVQSEAEAVAWVAEHRRHLQRGG